VSDKKLFVLFVLAMGALASGWWFGWFRPIAEQLRAIKNYTTY
jgi:hypothetical protein